MRTQKTTALRVSHLPACYEYPYVYTYDRRQRMTTKQVPGGGTTRMIYDQ